MTSDETTLHTRRQQTASSWRASRGAWVFRVLHVVALFVLLEVLVRTFISSPSHTLPDAVLGWRYQPDSSFLVASNDAGYMRLQVNERGLNDLPLASQQGRQRVLVLGDSFVEAAQVPREQNFTSLLERRFPDLDVVNAGRTGIDPRGLLNVYQTLAPVVQPAKVIMIVTDNDFLDLQNTRYDALPCADRRQICGYELRAGEKGRIKDILRPLMASSGLATYLLGRYDDLLKRQVDRVLALTRSRPLDTGAGAPADAASDAAHVQTFAAVFSAIAAQRPLMVVFFPALKFNAGGAVDVDDASVRRGPMIAAALSVIADSTFVDAGGSLEEVYRRSGQPPLGFDFGLMGRGHLNRLGHEAVAEAIAQQLGSMHRVTSAR